MENNLKNFESLCSISKANKLLQINYESESVNHFQSCPTLWNPIDCSPPGSSVQGIVQIRILEWVAIPFSRGSSQSREWTQISFIGGRFFTIWATREVKVYYHGLVSALTRGLDAKSRAGPLPTLPPGSRQSLTCLSKPWPQKKDFKGSLLSFLGLGGGRETDGETWVADGETPHNWAPSCLWGSSPSYLSQASLPSILLWQSEAQEEYFEDFLWTDL